jgi:FHA domain/Domain of unknown function (DUF4189)
MTTGECLEWQHAHGEPMRAVARLAFVIFVAAATLLPTRAMGFGAFAEAEGETNSIKWEVAGWELNAQSQSEAEMTAVKNCEAVRAKAGYRGPQCRIVATFSEKCLAVASTGEGKLGIGWGIAADAQAAEREALARCRDRAGRDNAGSCSVVRSADCDKAPAPNWTPVTRTVAAVSATGAIGVLLWKLAGGAIHPAGIIFASISGLVGVLYLVVSFTGGEASGGAVIARNEVEQAVNTARTAMYVSFAVAITAAMAVILTLRWASTRMHAMQVAMDRIKSGATRIFVSRSSVAGTTHRTKYDSTTGQVGSTRSGITVGARETRAESSDGAIQLQPKDGTAAIVLDTRLLQGAGVLIGRQQSCDVVTRDEKMSSRHAKLSMDGKGTLRIEDLDSTNGTWRDGERVKTASLRSGSVLKLGSTEYTVKIRPLR